MPESQVPPPPPPPPLHKTNLKRSRCARCTAPPTISTLATWASGTTKDTRGGPGRGRVWEERLGRTAVTSFPSGCACRLSAPSPRFAAAVLYLLLQRFVAANCISKKPPVGAAKVHFAKEQHYFCSSEKKKGGVEREERDSFATAKPRSKPQMHFAATNLSVLRLRNSWQICRCQIDCRLSKPQDCPFAAANIFVTAKIAGNFVAAKRILSQINCGCCVFCCCCYCLLLVFLVALISVDSLIRFSVGIKLNHT